MTLHDLYPKCDQKSDYVSNSVFKPHMRHILNMSNMHILQRAGKAADIPGEAADLSFFDL